MTVIHRVDSPQELAGSAAALIVELAKESIDANGSFSLVLAGGTTPKPIYQQLAQMLPASRVDPMGIYVFWGDERCVPSDDPMSNYRMAHNSWLGESTIPGGQIHPMHCEEDPHRGAEEYENILRSQYPDAEAPEFDLVLLGLGPDGHTASLFPGSALIDEQDRWVAVEFVEKVGGWRMTLTPPALNGARNAAFLVQGKEKAEAAHQVIVGEHDPHVWPAQVIEPPDGQLHWFLDEAAATLL